MLVLVALAVVEELLWDALVFRDYLPALCRNLTAAPPGPLRGEGGEVTMPSSLTVPEGFGRKQMLASAMSVTVSRRASAMSGMSDSSRHHASV